MSMHLLHAMILSASVADAGLARQAAPHPETSAPGQYAKESPARTGKERLGAKWTDEQRLNNCGVPPDKRGDTPRPDRCESEDGG